MATPTATAPKRPPSIAHSSPAAAPPPRSVPSPVAARSLNPSQNQAQTQSQASSATKPAAATPMMHNLSQTGSNPSPSATHFLSFNTPVGLAIDGLTPTPAASASASVHPASATASMMLPTMSDLGLGTSNPPRQRNEDAERRARMRRVLRSIGKPRGRVGEEGIARVSRRVGFANDIDVSEKLTPSERERKLGNRPITIAGNTVMIEIALQRHAPVSLSVTHNVAGDTLQRDAERAGKVLLRDLQPPEGIPLNAKLDRFSRNLEALAQLDRISSARINCFEALDGLYTSLRRLNEAELKAELAGAKDVSRLAAARMEVMCKRSGLPSVHVRRRLGLELAYWNQSRAAAAAAAAMANVDTQNSTDTIDVATLELPGEADEKDDQLFALRIGVEPSPPGIYTSLRVSDSWLPETIELPATTDPTSIDSASSIPWQEPPPTYLAPATDPGPSVDAMAIDDDGGQKLPSLRFVARFSPPILLPFPIAQQIISTVDASGLTMMTLPPQYAAALLSPGTAQSTASLYSATATQEVLSVHSGIESTVTHMYTLDTARPGWSHEIEELPFSHPRQLINMLPLLRQWACLGSLLRTTFATLKTTSSPADSEAENSTLPLDSLTDNLPFPSKDQINIKTNKSNQKIPITILLATDPIPTLNITFPLPDLQQPKIHNSASENLGPPKETKESQKLASITLQILPNAELVVVDHEGVFRSTGDVDGERKGNGNDDGMGDREQARAKQLAKALDVCGDLGVWIEWVRRLER